MKKMSKTKLTYITPVLDFVQTESEGQLVNTASGFVDNPESGDGSGSVRTRPKTPTSS